MPGRCTQEELVFLCPQCGDQSGNRSVNARTGKTNCWRCNKGGDFVHWARGAGYSLELEALPAPTITELQVLTESLGKPIQRTGLGGFALAVKLPEGFTPLIEERPGQPAWPRGSGYYRLVAAMAERKRLDVDTFEANGVGITRAHRLWEPYAIFPVYEWGKVVYYQGRTYTDAPGESTKKFPSRQECPQGSRFWVYGIDELREAGGVAIVVEAILNVLSLRRELVKRGISAVPVAVFKHKISAEQLGKLMACRGLKEICLMYDDDALASAYQEAKRLCNRVPITYVRLPKGVDANDDASLAVDLFERRQEYSSLEQLGDLAGSL